MTEINEDELKDLLSLKEDVKDMDRRLIELEKAKKEFEVRMKK